MSHRSLAMPVLLGVVLLFEGSMARLALAQPSPTPGAAPAPSAAPPPAAAPSAAAPSPPAAPPPSAPPAAAPAPPSDGPSAERAAAAAAEARELNRQGITLLDAGDLERALDHFLRARKVLATTKNTTNAAIVLDRLGRYDESLELYEELLLRYAGGLDDEDRAAIGPAMAELRKKVGSIGVSSSVGGAVFIDGRARGKLPLSIPIRVLPGRHTVRVVRSGYVDFSTTTEVAAGQTIAVEATLDALQGVGQLLVEEVDGSFADVFVDGVKLGTTPWEGSLPPGEHLVWLRVGEDRGTAPSSVRVVGGQSALVRRKALPLGPPVTVRVEPRTARFDVDGVALGTDTWTGRLPVGSYALSVSEPGYFTEERPLELQTDGAPMEAVVKLRVDPDHPRWPRPEGSFLVEIYGGPLVGPTLAGTADEGCPEACDSSSLAAGYRLGARGGYRFPFGLAVELGGGYLSLRQSIARTETETFGEADTTIDYELEDEVHVRGPFFTAGASWRAELGNFFVGARGTFGVLVASASDPLDGTARTNSGSTGVFVEDPGKIVVSAAPFLSPEALAGVRLGPIDLGLSLGLAFFPAEGKELDRGSFGPETRDDVDPTDPAAAPFTTLTDGEVANGPFWVFSPAVTAAMTF